VVANYDGKMIKIMTDDKKNRVKKIKKVKLTVLVSGIFLFIVLIFIIFTILAYRFNDSVKMTDFLKNRMIKKTLFLLEKSIKISFLLKNFMKLKIFLLWE